MSAEHSKISQKVLGFLVPAARGDTWKERSVRLSDVQTELRPAVAGHAGRVADTAAVLARSVGISERDVQALHAATLLHDVGKLTVSEDILFKPGALAPEERQEMQMHAAYGYALLNVSDTPELVLDIAKYHHERYDGKGYFGVQAELIPFTARIVAIGDVHDALTAKREYKDSIPEVVALSMMTADLPAPAMGRAAFDPFLLRRFVHLRLQDPSFEASDAQRLKLEEFAGSDPMSDLAPPGPDDVVIKRTGHRMQYGTEDGGVRKLLSMTLPDGSLKTDFPRMAILETHSPAHHSM